MTKAMQRVLMAMTVLALVAVLALSGCGSDGGDSDLVGPAEDIMLFPGGTDSAKLLAPVDKGIDPNTPGINLGINGHFHSLGVLENHVANNWFMTKANVCYQVEMISEDADVDVDLYIGRTARPFTDGGWAQSNRAYPLMDGIVFKSMKDGIMYVDVVDSILVDAGSKGEATALYRIHVRKCQFGTYNQ